MLGRGETTEVVAVAGGVALAAFTYSSQPEAPRTPSAPPVADSLGLASRAGPAGPQATVAAR